MSMNMGDSRPMDPRSLFPTIMKTFDKATNKKPQHVWSEPDAKNFNVRGAKYLKDKRKMKASCSQYSLIGIDLVLQDNVEDPLQCTTSRPFLSFAKARARGFKGFVFIINFIASYGNFIIYWTPSRNLSQCSSSGQQAAAAGDLPGSQHDEELLPYLTGHRKFDSLMKRFVEGDDEFRNNRLKVIPIVVEGNYFLRNFVGKPAIMCNKIETQWTRDLSPEANFLHADIQISSSSMAVTILGLVRHYVESVTLDMAFTIEGRDQTELPEELLCAMRFHHVDMERASQLADLESEWREQHGDDAKAGDSTVTRNGHSHSTSHSAASKTTSSAPGDLENVVVNAQAPLSSPHLAASQSVGGDQPSDQSRKAWKLRRKKDKAATLAHSYTPSMRPRKAGGSVAVIPDEMDDLLSPTPHSKSDDEVDLELGADLEEAHRAREK